MVRPTMVISSDCYWVLYFRPTRFNLWFSFVLSSDYYWALYFMPTMVQLVVFFCSAFRLLLSRLLQAYHCLTCGFLLFCLQMTIESSTSGLPWFDSWSLPSFLFIMIQLVIFFCSVFRLLLSPLLQAYQAQLVIIFCSVFRLLLSPLLQAYHGSTCGCFLFSLQIAIELTTSGLPWFNLWFSFVLSSDCYAIELSTSGLPWFNLWFSFVLSSDCYWILYFSLPWFNLWFSFVLCSDCYWVLYFRPTMVQLVVFFCSAFRLLLSCLLQAYHGSTCGFLLFCLQIAIESSTSDLPWFNLWFSFVLLSDCYCIVYFRSAMVQLVVFFCSVFRLLLSPVLQVCHGSICGFLLFVFRLLLSPVLQVCHGTTCGFSIVLSLDCYWVVYFRPTMVQLVVLFCSVFKLLLSFIAFCDHLWFTDMFHWWGKGLSCILTQLWWMTGVFFYC